MAKIPKCGCGCGTDLKPRRDGTFASYAPGGHDAKHKSALIRAVLDKDDKKALETLTAKNWLPFLEKSRAAREKQSKTSAAKRDPARHTRPASQRDEQLRFGLTARDLQLLDTPPTEETWYCTELHGFAEGDPESLIPNAGSKKACWFCQTKRPADAPLVWPLYQEALERLGRIDLESVIAVSRQELGEVLSWKLRSEAPDDMLLARKILRLHRELFEGGEEETTEEVTDGEALNPA